MSRWQQFLPGLALTSMLINPVHAAAKTAEKSPAAKNFEKPPFTTQVMENGLDIVVMEDHKVPLVTIVLTSKAGAMTETPETNGLTHLWEHMFFKGNKRLPNQEAFRQRIRELGIVYNGDTSAEKVRYYFTLPSAYLEQGLQFMADAIQTPLLEQKELERERHVVLDEYDRNASRPEFNFYRLNNRLIYGDQDYQVDPLGKRPLIEKATREQLLAIKDEVFVPKNSAILIAGDVDPKKLEKLVHKYFSSWENPKNWKPVQQPDLPPFPKSQDVVMTHKDARTVRIQETFAGPKARTEPKDSFAADILISLLNQRTGKFYKKYVDSGLTFGAGLSYMTQSRGAELNLYAMTDTQNALQVKKMLSAEPKEWLNKNYFTQAQLDDVRRSLLVSHKYEVNRPSEYIKTLGFWWAVTGLDYFRDYIPSMQAVTLDDVRSFVQRYFIDKPSLQMMFLSPEDAKKIGVKDNADSLVRKYFNS